MTLIAITNVREAPRIGPIELSVVLREVHSNTATITDHPVEQGGLISDHRRKEKPGLAMDAICSDAVTESGAEIDDEGNVTRDPLNLGLYTWRENADRMQALFDGDELFTVVTTSKVYENMHFVRYDVTRDANTDEVLSFTAELRPIEFASAEVVSVAPAPKTPAKAGGKKDKGPKGTTPAPAKVEQDSGSALHGMFGRR